MYDAKAIGSGSEGAQSSLQEVYHKGMTMTEAEEKLLIILKQVMEEKLNSTNVEVRQLLDTIGIAFYYTCRLPVNLEILCYEIFIRRFFVGTTPYLIDLCSMS